VGIKNTIPIPSKFIDEYSQGIKNPVFQGNTQIVELAMPNICSPIAQDTFKNCINL
jgi:hypothetical protein